MKKFQNVFEKIRDRVKNVGEKVGKCFEKKCKKVGEQVAKCL